MKTKFNFSKKLVSILLAVLMVTSILPMSLLTANAAPKEAIELQRNGNEKVSYNGGATIYYKFNYTSSTGTLLLKAEFYNMKNIKKISMRYRSNGEIYFHDGSNAHEFLIKPGQSSTSSAVARASSLPSNPGESINYYLENNEWYYSDDLLSPVATFTCIAVDSPVWSWNGTNAKAVFTASDGGATVTIDASEKRSSTPGADCQTKGTDKYTATAKCNSTTYTDTKSFEGAYGPHLEWYDATCTSKKTCKACGATEGDYAHDFSEATCTTPSTCSICGTTKGDVNPEAHAPSDKWTQGKDENGRYHYHDCLHCHAELDKAYCTAEAATCLNATYCDVCEFEYEAVNPANHKSSETSCILIDREYHGTYHNCCGALEQGSKQAHNNEGGEASCVGFNKCSLCNSTYGTTDSSNHVEDFQWIKLNDKYHIKYYPCCDSKYYDEQEHNLVLTVDEETDTVSAVCSDCGATGDVTLTSGDVVYNGYKYEPTYHGTGVLESPYFSVATYSFAFTDANGNKVNECINNGNYTVTMTVSSGDSTASVSKDFNIAKREIKVSLVDVFPKAFDGTTDIDIYGYDLDGVVVYSTGTSVEAYDDVKDDVKLDVDALKLTVSDSIPGNYETGTLTGIKLVGKDIDNYFIAGDTAEVNLKLPVYYDDLITENTVFIEAHDQYLVGEEELDQTAYTMTEFDSSKFEITGVVLAENTYSNTIDVITDSIKVTLNGEDVTDYFYFETYSGNLARVCAGHTFDDNGFCATGKCEAYQPAVKGTSTDAYGNEIEVYEIYNAGQLYWFAQQVNVYGQNNISGKLMADIIVNYRLTDENLREWTPIGSSYTPYTGFFDGNGNTVTGLYCKEPERSYVGFFGATDYGNTITNLHITNSYFEGNENVGGLFGYAGSNINHCTVSGSVTVKGNNYIGGIAGSSSFGELKNSYSHADVTIDKDYCTGGLVGNNCLTISDCYTLSSNAIGSNNSSYGGSAENVYFLSTEEDDVEGTTAVTEEQLASGEIAYELQSGVDGEYVYDEELGEWVTKDPKQIWGQCLFVDEYPQLSADVVYKVTACDDKTIYLNEDVNGTHSFDHDRVCEDCGALLGDVNCDNELSIIDATYIQFHLADIQVLDSEGLLRANVDYDSGISIMDASYIQMILADLM